MRIKSSLAALFVAIVTAGAMWLSAPAAQGACSSSTGGCQPGTGYTFDTGVWSCGGLQVGETCWESSPPTKNHGSGHSHSFGWMSADYDGGGSTGVKACLAAVTSASCGYYGWGTNIVRICVYNNCNDATGNLKAGVSTDRPHTVKGHGKA